MDVNSKKQRSYNMSKIKGVNTAPEIIIAKLLKDLHIPFIAHTKLLPGKPDFFIPSLGIVIEVYGCFWHAHKDCRFFQLPSTNKVFWSEKISSNKVRDKKNAKSLRSLGLQVLIVWECEIKSGNYFEKVLSFLACAPRR
jgi:DNA mismatch endonuclease (patch repair protein)